MLALWNLSEALAPDLSSTEVAFRDCISPTRVYCAVFTTRVNKHNFSEERNLKTYRFTRLVAILVFGAFVITACNKAANTNNSNSSNNANTASSPMANKNSGTPPTAGDYSTPTAAFKTFYYAVKANDIEAVKRSMSKKAMEDVTRSAAQENKSVDDSLKDMSKDTPAGLPEVRNEKIEGDKASAEMKDDKMDRWIPIYFVKEDGKWKIALNDEKAAGMDHGDMQKK